VAGRGHGGAPQAGAAPLPRRKARTLAARAAAGIGNLDDAPPAKRKGGRMPAPSRMRAGAGGHFTAIVSPSICFSAAGLPMMAMNVAITLAGAVGFAASSTTPGVLMN